MTETLCLSGSVKIKAGANASTTITNNPVYMTELINEAEGLICTMTRYDWVTNYASVSTIGKEALRDACASYAAVQVINYDMSGFTSRQEALTMVNILWASFMETMRLIQKDNKYSDFILTGEGDID